MGKPYNLSFFLHSTWRASGAYRSCRPSACSQNLSFPLHATVGTLAILRPSQNRSSYLHIFLPVPTPRPPTRYFKYCSSLPTQLHTPAGRRSDRLTVEKGAGPPETCPRAPPPAGARTSRGLAGPLPKAAADWLLGRSATRAFRDGAGGGRFHHKPRAC